MKHILNRASITAVITVAAALGLVYSAAARSEECGAANPSLSDAQWIRGLYRNNVDREPSPAEIDYTSRKILCEGRSKVVWDIIYSFEARANLVAAVIYGFILQRPASQQEIVTWANKLAYTPANPNPPAFITAVRTTLLGTEFISKHSDRANYVKAAYLTLIFRPPTADELLSYLTGIKRFDSRTKIVNALINSRAFRLAQLNLDLRHHLDNRTPTAFELDYFDKFLAGGVNVYRIEDLHVGIYTGVDFYQLQQNK